MERKLLEEHLLQAERHVMVGRKHIARQIGIVAEFEGAGRDATVARALLRTFLSLQNAHEADRDRLIRELLEAG